MEKVNSKDAHKLIYSSGGDSFSFGLGGLFLLLGGFIILEYFLPIVTKGAPSLIMLIVGSLFCLGGMIMVFGKRIVTFDKQVARVTIAYEVLCFGSNQSVSLEGIDTVILRERLVKTQKQRNVNYTLSLVGDNRKSTQILYTLAADRTRCIGHEVSTFLGLLLQDKI